MLISSTSSCRFFPSSNYCYLIQNGTERNETDSFINAIFSSNVNIITVVDAIEINGVAKKCQ